jgi:hypothetical protein
MRRWQARSAVRKGALRWWLVYGPVRSGTTLMGNLAAAYARWDVSDWGLHAALTPPLSETPAVYDAARPRRALLAEVLASCTTGHRGPLDLVYKQANLRQPELEALVDLIGPPERRLFCLRDPAGFMQSATRKFPDIDLDNLRDINYIGTLEEHARIGGEVFLYHPGVTGEDYARVLRPLLLTPEQLASVNYTGSSAPELTTEPMWEHFRRLASVAVNAPVVEPS